MMKGKPLVNAALTILILVLGYFLYHSLFDNYFFAKRKAERYEATRQRLREILGAQEIFKQAKGSYAASFEDLERALHHDSLAQIRTIGVENDTVQIISLAEALKIFNINRDLPDTLVMEMIENAIQEINKRVRYGEQLPVYLVRDTIMIPLRNLISFDTPIDSLRYIPGSKGDQFSMEAGVNALYGGRVNVPVLEVTAFNSSILRGEDEDFYLKTEGLKLGSLTEASTDISEIRERRD